MILLNNVSYCKVKFHLLSQSSTFMMKPVNCIIFVFTLKWYFGSSIMAWGYLFNFVYSILVGLLILIKFIAVCMQWSFICVYVTFFFISGFLKLHWVPLCLGPNSPPAGVAASSLTPMCRSCSAAACVYEQSEEQWSEPVLTLFFLTWWLFPEGLQKYSYC